MIKILDKMLPSNTVLKSNVNGRLGDISELPPELQAQLSKLPGRKAVVGGVRNRVVPVMDELYGGIANIDEILVGLYKMYDFIGIRKNLSSILYSMVNVGDISKFSGKRGVFITKRAVEESE